MAWPLLVDDDTEVVEVDPGSRLVLHARAWPTGTAAVTLRLEPVGAHTRVVIEEDAHQGPGRLVPKPLRQPPLTWRNVETLRRLAYVVEGRSRTSLTGPSLRSRSAAGGQRLGLDLLEACSHPCGQRLGRAQAGGP